MQDSLNVAVIGAGLMGHGIAQVFATYGHAVSITDPNVDVLHETHERVAHNLAQMGIPPEPVLARIATRDDVQATVTDADIVIEAAPERLALKQAIFADLARWAPASAILASNTSVIPITDIGALLDESVRERVVGTHWWNPPHLVPLVEVIRTTHTSDAVFEQTFGILERIGKRPVKVLKDIPGFIGNRLQHAMWREAIALVEHGICDADTIDDVVKHSFGPRLAVLGPMENADLTGLELARDVHRVLFPHLDYSTIPSPLLDDLLAQGHRGMKTGKGLREWTPETARAVREQLALHLIATFKIA